MIGKNNSINHPCYGMSCEMCETCIFDEDIFSSVDANKTKMKETCNKCSDLIKNYCDTNKLQFNACCGRFSVTYSNFSRPRVIKHKTGNMLEIPAPDWCPKSLGITKKYIHHSALGLDEKGNEIPKATALIPLKPAENVHTPPVKLTYYEKKEEMKKYPRHIEWENIKEGDVYVIPKILAASRKVIRVVTKTDTILRYSEIDELGNETKYCTSLYPNDLETVFLIELHKY